MVASGEGWTLYNADCLDVLPTLEAGSIDAVITDPPYGTTACKWDSVIPFEPMWAGIKHVIKRNAAVVLFGSQPFTSALVMSNPKWFRYEWVWDKVNLFTNQMNAKRRPMRQHENVTVFYTDQPIYNPQWRQGKPYKTQRKGLIEVFTVTRRNGENLTGQMHPGTVLAFPGRLPDEQGLHPTQKPVALLEYLIRTYTNEGDTVLDFTMGSGTTGVACLNTGRRFIGIELDPGYFEIARQRLEAASAQKRLAV